MITEEQYDKEVKTAWIYCGDTLLPFWRKLFFSNKKNYKWFKKKLKEDYFKVKIK